MEQQQNEDAESGIKKSKLVRGLKKQIRELEDKLLESEKFQPKGDVPSITVETTAEQKPPSENQVIESEKYQQVVKEKEELEKEKRNLDEKYRNHEKTVIYLQSCVRRMIARRKLKQLKASQSVLR